MGEINFNNISFSKQEFENIVNDLYNLHEDKFASLEEGKEIPFEHIYANSNSNKFIGFKIQGSFYKNEKKTIELEVQNVISYDDEDEWIKEYQRIKQLKTL